MCKKHGCETAVVMQINPLHITRYVLFFWETDSTKREKRTTIYCDYKLSLPKDKMIDVNYIITYVKYQGDVSENIRLSTFFSVWWFPDPWSRRFAM